jgi:hypothetical protein
LLAHARGRTSRRRLHHRIDPRVHRAGGWLDRLATSRSIRSIAFTRILIAFDAHNSRAWFREHAREAGGFRAYEPQLTSDMRQHHEWACRECHVPTPIVWHQREYIDDEWKRVERFRENNVDNCLRVIDERLRDNSSPTRIETRRAPRMRCANWEVTRRKHWRRCAFSNFGRSRFKRAELPEHPRGAAKRSLMRFKHEVMCNAIRAATCIDTVRRNARQDRVRPAANRHDAMRPFDRIDTNCTRAVVVVTAHIL